MLVSNNGSKQYIKFKKCVIATGSRSTKIPNIKIDGEFVLTSKDALQLKSIPDKMLIIGGGYIGLEMATFYKSIGAEIDIAEFLPDILSEMDKDLVKILRKQLEKRFNIMLETKVTNVIQENGTVSVTIEDSNRQKKIKKYNKVLVCVGRKPNTDKISIESTGIQITKKGFIEVNSECRTLIPNIFAIGDVTGNPMLAHKATHQGKIVAEIISGQKSSFNPNCIPYVIFTNPEIAWAGPSENDLKDMEIDYDVKSFPWQASGRALALGASFGKTKLIYSKNSHKILSVGIIGPNAGDLIGEAALAIEMDAFVEDIALTIHPHPTLTETFSNTAEMIEGTITDLYHPKKN